MCRRVSDLLGNTNLTAADESLPLLHIMPTSRSTTRPFRWRFALEGRALFEAASVLPALPLLAGTPQGDGHPVLVLPGFSASDQSTRTLRRFLRTRGYTVHGWKLGRNAGLTPELLAGLIQRFAEVQVRQNRTVSVIGWSLGGLYARELARAFPADVRQVITLGSPVRSPVARDIAVLMQWVLSELREDGPADRATIEERLRLPLRVPVSALYSRSDGIVSWRRCLEEAGPRRENIPVVSSHLGMGANPAVLFVIANRLAQPEGSWRAYSPTARTAP